MKVHHIRSDHPTSDILSTIAPLNYLLRLFGLSCISCEGVKLKYSWSLKKVIFLITLFILLSVCCIYLKFTLITSPWNSGSFQFKDSIQVSYLFDLIHYTADLVFVYKYGRQRCVDYYCTYEHIDKVLGKLFYSNVRKRIINICTFLIVVWFISMVCDFLSWSLIFGWFIPVAYFVDLIYLGLKVFSYLDVISNVVQIEYRLKAIEDALGFFYCSMENVQGIIKDVICKEYTKNSDTNNLKLNNLECLKPFCVCRANVILRVNRCYLLLLEQCNYINIMFGYRIILGNMVSLLNIIIAVNLMIRILSGTLVPGEDIGYFPVITTAMRIFTYFVMPFCTVYTCEETYKQTKSIIRLIDHTVTNKKINMEVRESLSELRDLVVTRPVNFTAANVYRLEYPTLVSLASAVITYSLLLLQYVK